VGGTVLEFSPVVGVHHKKSSNQWEARAAVPEEMSKTLLTKKKLGKKEKVHANIVIALFGKNVFMSIENLRSP
jgi:hypothetical protein